MNDALIDQLVERYRTKESQLGAAIDCDRRELVHQFDRELVVLFERIIEYDPKSKSELITLCKFLVEKLRLLGSSSPTGVRISDRIIQLIEAGDWRYQLAV